MPTFYANCGCVISDDPVDETVYGTDAVGADTCDGCSQPEEDEEGNCDCAECRSQRQYNGSDPDRDTAVAIADAVRSLPVGDVPNMLIPNLRRAVSCEWEATGGTDYAAIGLEHLGTAGADFENVGDGTCDGELVFGFVGLEDGRSAERYGRSVELLHRLKTEGIVSVGDRAGHHIHISAVDSDGACFTPNALVTLYSVYAHCEDLLYRLASAGWRRHRTESVGDYARSIPQLGRAAKKTPKTVGMAISDTRYYGLNVTRFIEGMRQCQCGAFRFGDWGSCECPAGSKTIEWRLWNSAVSPRKIRTYIALSHAITDYAARHTTDGHADLEPNVWAGTQNVDEDSLSKQLAFLSSLPGMTRRDRDDIRWAVSISPGMGDLASEYSEDGNSQ